MEFPFPDSISLPVMHATIRRKVLDRLPKLPGHVALFQGGVSSFQYDTDHEHLFRQESHFHYLFGVNEPNLFGLLDPHQSETYLFVPRLDADHEIWCGKIKSPAEYSQQYAIDHVRYVDELSSELERLGASTILVLDGVNHDSGHSCSPVQFTGIERFVIERAGLLDILCESRLIKTDLELDLMKHVNAISSRAHLLVMQNCRPGMFEFQLEADFIRYGAYHGGSRYTAYTCICGAGRSAAVLHYGHAGAPNDQRLQAGDMCLLDMGSELHCYASDITCSYPANGKFSDAQRDVYEIVLAAQKAVEGALRPGIEWADMHMLASKVICQGLLDKDFLRGASVDALMALHVHALFFPHGLGHLLGLDTHDVGGILKDRPALQAPGLRCLRMNRILQAGMVVTNEPGLYFIEALLRPAFDDPNLKGLLNVPKIVEHFGFGGVRLEDDLIITESGCHNMTRVPRTVDDIERVMAGGSF